MRFRIGTLPRLQLTLLPSSLGLLALLHCLLQPVALADDSWIGGTSGNPTNWNTNSNWVAAVQGDPFGAPSAGENAVFDSNFTGTFQPNVSGNQSVGGIWMKSSAVQNVTISGTGTLKPQGDTILSQTSLGILVESGSPSLTITANIQLAGNQTWLNNSANLLTIASATSVDLFDTTDVDPNRKTLTIGGSGDTLISTAVNGNGSGNFTKINSGTLTLTGLNNYAGPTVVTGGTLQVGVNGIGRTGTGGTTVGTGLNIGAATLAGTGTVGGNSVITGAATLKPGDNKGTTNGGLTFNGNLNLNNDSLTQLKITSPGNHDTITVNGQLTLGTTNTNPLGTINVVDNGYVANAQAGDMFDLLDWTTLNVSTFRLGTTVRSGGLGGGDLNLPDLSSTNLFWDVSQFTTNGSITVVTPEPSRVMLLAIGGSVLLRRRRRGGAA
jgi:autotransporter-associated beta strand protein